MPGTATAKEVLEAWGRVAAGEEVITLRTLRDFVYSHKLKRQLPTVHDHVLRPPRYVPGYVSSPLERHATTKSAALLLLLLLLLLLIWKMSFMRIV